MTKITKEFLENQLEKWKGAKRWGKDNMNGKKVNVRNHMIQASLIIEGRERMLIDLLNYLEEKAK